MEIKFKTKFSFPNFIYYMKKAIFLVVVFRGIIRFFAVILLFAYSRKFTPGIFDKITCSMENAEDMVKCDSLTICLQIYTTIVCAIIGNFVRTRPIGQHLKNIYPAKKTKLTDLFLKIFDRKFLFLIFILSIVRRVLKASRIVNFSIKIGAILKEPDDNGAFRYAQVFDMCQFITKFLFINFFIVVIFRIILFYKNSVTIFFDKLVTKLKNKFTFNINFFYIKKIYSSVDINFKKETFYDFFFKALYYYILAKFYACLIFSFALFFIFTQPAVLGLA